MTGLTRLSHPRACRHWLPVLLLLAPFTRAAAGDWEAQTAPPTTLQRAAEYSRQYAGDALLILSRDKLVFEDYAAAAGPDKPHRLASGSKTFWGLLAVAAAQDGLLRLDERVADTLTEWRDDPRKAQITVRQLLNFTSGLDPEEPVPKNRRATTDTFRQALLIPAIQDPGTTFAYGPSHLSVFGAWLERKLKRAGRPGDPLAYLKERVLDPIGLTLDDWRRDGAGHPVMAAGAYVAPRQWAKLGQLIANQGRWENRQVIEERYLREIFSGSQANPGYGLTLWLNQGVGETQAFATEDDEQQRRYQKSDGGFIYRDGPRDLVMAAGKGKQRLYIVPSRNLVIVRQGESKGGYADADFLALLMDQTGNLKGVDQAPPQPAATGQDDNWRAACRSDIQALCGGFEHNLRGLRRCYRRFAAEFSPECRHAVQAARDEARAD